MTRLPRHWLALRSGGTGRRFGADLELRRTRPGRFLLLRHGRLVWRSRGLYPNDGGDVAFGPRAFAFASYRRGLFLTDLESPERLVMPGSGLFPIDFTRRGELVVSVPHAIAVVSRSGATLRRYPLRRRTGYTFDEKTDSVFFVTPDETLARASGTRLRRLRTVRGIKGSLTAEPGGFLFFQAMHGVTITRRDGAVVARARWRAGALDSGVDASPDGRTFAFRLSTARPGSRRARATVYLVRANQTQAHVLYSHHLGRSGCASGARLTWHRRFLLYSSLDGKLTVLDTQRRGVQDLGRFARTLPRLGPNERADAFWLSDLP